MKLFDNSIYIPTDLLKSSIHDFYGYIFFYDSKFFLNLFHINELIKLFNLSKSYLYTIVIFISYNIYLYRILFSIRNKEGISMNGFKCCGISDISNDLQIFLSYKSYFFNSPIIK